MMRVLLVEDEALIGLDLAMTMQEWGLDVDGPHKSVARALAAIDRQRPDVAVLDVNLGKGETSIPIADALQGAGIPFLFLTGYALKRIDASDRFDDVRCLRKPVAMSALKAQLNEFRGAEA